MNRSACILAFIGASLLALFTGGCIPSGSDGSGSGSGAGVAERAEYARVVSWNPASRVAELSDGFSLYVIEGEGTYQRPSCSWRNDFPGAEQDFEDNIGEGVLLFYRVYIANDFNPFREQIANQATIVNEECFVADPCTCGCPAVPADPPAEEVLL